ncbi:MAG: hypothetical protein GXX84_13970 [Acidobacteria bacterium]|nr:hypothetical protein [Acidobacteriota bacterium]
MDSGQDRIRYSVKRRSGIISAVCMALLMFSAGHADAAQKQDGKLDYALAQKDMLKFEMNLNNLISSVFSSNPFAVVQKAKGAYLPGYGASISFLINIHRAVINSPFGEIRTRDLSPELKKRRIEELKEKLIRLLQDSGQEFRQLSRNDCVTIVAHVEDRNFPGEPNSNRIIVLSVLKKDLDEFGRKADRFNEFKQRMKIVEY